jgi:hypothetical protein
MIDAFSTASSGFCDPVRHKRDLPKHYGPYDLLQPLRPLAAGDLGSDHDRAQRRP